MFVGNCNARPLGWPRSERNERPEKPQANLGENIQHSVDTFKNVNTTTSKVAIGAGGILGLGYILHNGPEAIKGFIVKHCPSLEKPAAATFKGLKSITDKAGELVSKLMSGPKVAKVVTSLKKEIAPLAEKAAGILSKIPGPWKVAGAAVAGLILLNGERKAGKIDQKYEDQVNLRHSFERE